jgi:hypothetical protein
MTDAGTPEPQGPLNELARDIHRIAKEHGFWEADRNFGEIIALIHSEASEALEEHREGRPVHYVPVHQQGCPFSGEGLTPSTAAPCGLSTCKPEGAAVELGDVIIRCLDALRSMGVDIDAIVGEKIAYNDARPYKHGKAY